jgi:anaerobic selenocysteine-containing dehydrogenase
MGTQGVLQGGPSMDGRFFNRLGAAELLGTICFAAGSAAWGMTYPGWAPADIEDAVQARTVVAWGANMVSTHLHLWKCFLDARKQGATIVCVDLWTRTKGRRCPSSCGPAVTARWLGIMSCSRMAW